MFDSLFSGLFAHTLDFEKHIIVKNGTGHHVGKFKLPPPVFSPLLFFIVVLLLLHILATYRIYTRLNSKRASREMHPLQNTGGIV